MGSDRRALPQAMTMEAYALDVISLMDEKGIERAVVGGLSMGGYVAMALAELFPERLEALLLINTRSTADTEEGKAAREATAQRATQDGMNTIARAMLPTLLSEKTRHERPEVGNYVERMIARQDPDAVAAASRGMALRPDRTAVLSRLTVPALIITGAYDLLMPLPTSQAMAEALPGTELVVLEAAAHLGNLEDPDRFNKVVLGFLQRL